MSDYTPSTDEVRDQYASVPFSGIPTHARAEFDRWLESVEAAAEERGAKAERERVARNIEAEANHDVVRNATLATAARIAREGA